MKWTHPSKLFWLLAIVIPFYLTWTFDHSLWNPDETRDAGIASEMYRNQSFVVPTLNGEVFLEKPPLYYWSCSLVYWLSGKVTAGTTRLPSALYGILGILFTFLLGRRLFNDNIGFVAGLMLATTLQYFKMSHFAMMDVSLAALVAGALYFYVIGSKVGFSVFTILAFFSKGFLGIILPGLVVIGDCILEKKPKELAKWMGVGAVFFVALAGPWLWALWQKGGRQFLEIFLIDNHWHRFFSESADHTEHFWFYYFLSFPVDFLPWSLWFIVFIKRLIQNFSEILTHRGVRFVLTWFVALFVFFTISSSKRSIYLLPLFPAGALLSAYGIGGIQSRIFQKAHVYVVSLFVFLLMVSSITVVKRLDIEKTFVPLCDVIKSNMVEGVFVGYNLNEMERGVFGFYLNSTFKNVLTQDELAQFINGHSSQKILVLVNRNKMHDMANLSGIKLEPLFAYRPEKRTRSYILYESVDRRR
ncbi:MAG: Undecaprenyl phosphate-alpha-4-amino-4-deoxy-L-arabinose arabinosyl transferase [Elusimicrobia bacterium]|nr:Undecaprenyl phosphate-alpha-4-amino-4-deoxy-L-arabinose arabinosyl transferase [Elusimicrobiota bacterium]